MDILYSPEGGVQIVGTMTLAARFDIEPGAWRVGLRFRPGMGRRFLRIDSSELVDRVIPLADVIGARAHEWRGRLDSAESNDERRRILLESVSGLEQKPDPVHLAIEAMTRAHGEVDVESLAVQAGISSRQFRRRCREEAGLGPKQLARVLRFRRACALAARGESWLRVAVEAGYFDQAHLIRDFREFTGATPVSDFSKTGGDLAG
jgi:AraC-like DNA-binding protein